MSRATKQNFGANIKCIFSGLVRAFFLETVPDFDAVAVQKQLMPVGALQVERSGKVQIKDDSAHWSGKQTTVRDECH